MREGLKLDEAYLIVRHLRPLIEEEEMEEDAAYREACRAVVGVAPKTLAAWKPDIFKLLRGEPTPASPVPADAPRGFPGTTAHSTIKALRDEAEEKDAELKRLKKELDKKDAELRAVAGLDAGEGSGGGKKGGK
jgi:hypothetical protein